MSEDEIQRAIVFLSEKQRMAQQEAETAAAEGYYRESNHYEQEARFYALAVAALEAQP